MINRDTTKELMVASFSLGTALLLLFVIVQMYHSKVQAVEAMPETTCSPTSYWCINPSPNLAGSNQLNAIAVTGYTDTWAVGVYNATPYGGGTLAEHWNGVSWTINTSPNAGLYNTLSAVSSKSSTDVWSVGSYYTDTSGPQRTLVEWWNGSSWIAGSSPDPGAAYGSVLSGLAVSGTNQAWAVGTYSHSGFGYNTLIESCGVVGSTPTCTQVPSLNISSTYNVLIDVAVRNTTDAWAVGYSADNPFAADARPLILHYNGTSWTPSTSPILTSYSILTGVDFFNANDVWVVGYISPDTGYYSALLEHWDGHSWTVIPISGLNAPNTTYQYLNHVFVTPAGDVWAVGTYGNNSVQPDIKLNLPNAAHKGSKSSTAPTISAQHPWVLHWNGHYWNGIDTPDGGSNNQFLGVAASLTSTWAVGAYTNLSSTQQTFIESFAAPTAPMSTTSFYESSIDTKTHYYQGCAAARAGQSGIVVLDYGQPIFQPSLINPRYGTKLINSGGVFASTDQIASAVESYTQGYHDAFSTGTNCPFIGYNSTPITVAIGTSNFNVDRQAAITPAHAQAWAAMVNRVKSYVISKGYSGIYIAGAMDIEPNFSIPLVPTPPPSDYDYPLVATWVSNYSNQTSSPMYNYGSTDGYPCLATPTIPNPSSCSVWTPAQLYTVTWGISGTKPLPETYYQEWNRYWYLVKRWGIDNRPGSPVMEVAGGMADCLPNEVCYVDPTDPKRIPELQIIPGWQSLWEEINADPYTQPITWSTYITYTIINQLCN